MTDEKFLSVMDSSATAECPVREHHVYHDGALVGVKFEYGKPNVLPFSLGAKFILPGFTVKDANENELKLPSAESAALAEDEVVAKLSELTDDALKLRAIARVGGEKFAVDDVDRLAIINFLVTPPAVESEEEEELELEEDEDGEQADVQDNIDLNTPTEPTGKVPENAEDEIVLNVGGDEIVANDDEAEKLAG